MIPYSMTSSDGIKSLSVLFTSDAPMTIAGDHPKFMEILEALDDPNTTEESVKALMNSLYSIGDQLSRISERVSVAPYGVFFDGEPFRGELESVILALFKNSNDDDAAKQKLTALVNFIEKAKSNPSQQSVDALYRWIQKGDLVITPEGDFVAYKGVKLRDGVPVSINSGFGIVNGRVMNGNLPNLPGNVLEMPRSKVDADNAVGCSTGLHAGTYSYAKGFAQGVLLIVRINPRDVVSVPSDCQHQKLRVCRYTVLDSIIERIEDAYLPNEEDEEDDDYYDEEDDDGFYGNYEDDDDERY